MIVHPGSSASRLPVNARKRGPGVYVQKAGVKSRRYVYGVKRGKVHFGAAANDPTYSSLDQTSGPWWSIGIAGYEEGSSNGRSMTSGTLPDFVGDFTQELPYCRSCEEGLESVGGTSFATPRSAGTFSKILLEARRSLDHEGGIAVVWIVYPLAVAVGGWPFQLRCLISGRLGELRRVLRNGIATIDGLQLAGLGDFVTGDFGNYYRVSGSDPVGERVSSALPVSLQLSPTPPGPLAARGLEMNAGGPASCVAGAKPAAPGASAQRAACAH